MCGRLGNFQGGGSGGYPHRLRDVIGDTLNWQDSEWFPTQG